MTLNNGAVCTTGRTGAGATAINFDGVDDYALVAADPLGDDVFSVGGTVAAWVKADGPGGNSEGTIVYTDYGWFLSLEPGTPQSLVFVREHTTTPGGWRTPANSLTYGSWHHVVLTYDDRSSTTPPQIYVDGVSQHLTEVDAPSGRPISDAGHSRCIGNQMPASAAFGFDGLIDTPRVFRWILSAAEIRNMYASRGEWTFDDGAGTSVADLSEYGSEGTVTGAAWAEEGVQGAALDFDDVGDVVTVANHTDRNDLFRGTRSHGGGTVAAWIYPNSMGEASYGAIVTKSDAAESVGWLFYLDANNSVTLKRNFSRSDGCWGTAANSIPLNTWTHVAATYNDSSTSNDAVLYINGTRQIVTERCRPSGSALSDASQSVTIGSRVDGANTFDGLIDFVSMYKRILSASDVSELYSACSANGISQCQY